MKHYFTKIISYFLFPAFIINHLSEAIYASPTETVKLGESHYINGVPIVRRQFFIETEPTHNSSLKRTMENKKRSSNNIDVFPTKRLPDPIKMKNIVVFIRFKGEEEFVTESKIKLFKEHYNGDGISLRSYMKDISYDQFDVISDFFPIDDHISSYEAEHERSYYQPYNRDNPDGYKSRSSANKREFELLTKAIIYCKKMIEEKYPNPEDIDFNEDEKIDNVVFIVSGKEDSWDDLLWPHQFKIPETYQKAKIHNKQVGLYNFMLENCFKEGNIGTSVHEFLHTKGFPDLYRYKSEGIPVGCWDLMSMQYPIPQFPLVYPRYIYGSFCNPPSTIIYGGQYVLYPSTNRNYERDISYLMKSPIARNSEEFFAIEYRAIEADLSNFRDNCLDMPFQRPYNVREDRYFTWDKMLPGEGLLVYRINQNVIKGNAASDGIYTPDKIFIFRRGITKPGLADGDIDKGALLTSGNSLGVIEPEKKTRRYIDPPLDDIIYFSDGKNSGIRLYDIDINQEHKFASFRVEFDKTLITSVKLDQAKNITIDRNRKQILILLKKNFQDKYIVPKIEHNGELMLPGEGFPLIISDDMTYTITSPNGIKQLWKIILSPISLNKKETITVFPTEPVTIEANIINQANVTYQWYIDGKALVDETNDRITLYKPENKNINKVYVIATNEVGSCHCADTIIKWEDTQESNSHSIFSFLTDLFVDKPHLHKSRSQSVGLLQEVKPFSNVTSQAKFRNPDTIRNPETSIIVRQRSLSNIEKLKNPCRDRLSVSQTNSSVDLNLGVSRNTAYISSHLNSSFNNQLSSEDKIIDSDSDFDLINIETSLFCDLDLSECELLEETDEIDNLDKVHSNSNKICIGISKNFELLDQSDKEDIKSEGTHCSEISESNVDPKLETGLIGITENYDTLQSENEKRNSNR